MRIGEAPDKSLLDPIETASRDEITALQTRRLAATLRRTYECVPAIRAKFDAQGVHPDDFRGLADLVRFPLTAKADLRANYPFGLLAVREIGLPAFTLRRARLANRRWSAIRATISRCGPASSRGRSAPRAGARA
jgi:hypothetical protein